MAVASTGTTLEFRVVCLVMGGAGPAGCGAGRQQEMLGRGCRDADALRDLVREQSPGRWPTQTRRRVRARPVF